MSFHRMAQQQTDTLQVLCMKELAVALAEGVGKENRNYWVTAQDQTLTKKSGKFIPPLSGDVGILKLEDPSDFNHARPSLELHEAVGFTQIPVHIFEDAGLMLCKWEPPRKRICKEPERYCP